jgi:tripartite-type tricarboxylate transporter receptor subunit TctC
MRTVLRKLVAVVVCAAACAAHAQDYPNRPIKLVVPQAPGSGADVVARMLADSMAKQLGQPVVVDNRPGANGLIASRVVRNEAPDGYTLLQTSVSLVSFNKHMYRNLDHDPVRDFTFIAPVADASFVVVASKASGIRTWDELVKTGRANPDKLTFGSAGAGNSTHLYTEMIARRAGFKARHIPYKGSAPALMSIVAGETDFMVVPTVVAYTQIEAGKVTALAQSGDTRSAQLRDVPLLKEVAPDVPPLPGWYAIVGPAKMDPRVVDKLSSAVNRFLADREIKARLTEQFLFPIPGTPEGIRKRGEQEAQLWGGLIRDLKIEAD